MAPFGWLPLSLSHPVFLSSLHLLDWHAFTPWGFIFFYFLIKLSCNTDPSKSSKAGLSLQLFFVMRQNRGNYTILWHLLCCDSDLAWLKHPRPGRTRWRPSTAGAQFIKNSCGGSWQSSAGKVTRSPVCWKLGQWKTNSVESARVSVSDSRRSPVNVGGLHSYGWKDICLAKS